MQTQQIQLKISLSEQLNNLLVSKAASLGIPVTQFVKHLIVNEVETGEYPTFPASKKTIRLAKKALRERDKAIRVTDIHEYFKNL